MIDVSFIDVEYEGLDPEFFQHWFTEVVEGEKKQLGDVTLIFCSDEHLLKMNKEYLGHDYYTDIITFDYSELNFIAGDLFISLDRIKENAETLGVSVRNELNRVVIHGVLHLCGYKDKSQEDEKLMRFKEDEALAML